MPTSDFPANCLRPTFAEKLIGWLQRGKAINVIGDEGQGMQRLHEDVAEGCPPTVRFIPLSMRSYADSYAGFLQALSDALGIERTADADIRLVLNNFLHTSSQNIWLCLEHFDRLADKQVDNKPVDDKGYDIHFLNYLNSLHNNPRVSLLVCSRREIRAQELYIGGKAVSGSRLEFSEREKLPDLTFAEIEAYFERRLPNTAYKAAFFQQKPIFYTELITEIDAHPESVGFADLVAGQNIDPNWSLDGFRERLRFWKEEYTRLHARTIGNKLIQIEKGSLRWLSHVRKLRRIGNIWRLIFLILGLIGMQLFGGWKWLAEHVWPFISPYLH